MIGFAQFNVNSELASRIKLFVALGPVATIAYIQSPIKYIADLGVFGDQQLWFTLFGNKDFLPSNKFMKWLANKFCNMIVTSAVICENVIFGFCGPSKYLNKTRLSVYTTHTPAGSFSVRR